MQPSWGSRNQILFISLLSISYISLIRSDWSQPTVRSRVQCVQHIIYGNINRFAGYTYENKRSINYSRINVYCNIHKKMYSLISMCIYASIKPIVFLSWKNILINESKQRLLRNEFQFSLCIWWFKFEFLLRICKVNFYYTQDLLNFFKKLPLIVMVKKPLYSDITTLFLLFPI